MSQDATSLHDDIRREIDKLNQEATEAKTYIDRAEPHEAIHALNNGLKHSKFLSNDGKELHHLIEKPVSLSPR